MIDTEAVGNANFGFSSFGNNPNAQPGPPTPTQTPTSAQFPSPTFQTPRNNSNFENRSGWTPTFAEEYSVFNSTPGRLTSSHHNFVETSTPLPSTASAQNRRLSTTSDITAELASHVHHFSPNPGLPLPPVDPSNQLPSSPGPYSSTHNRFNDSATNKITPRKPKKRLEEAFSGQTATPPASASKGSRKLAPKISTDKMQSDSQDGHYGNSQTPTPHPNMLHFPSSSAEFFYPMSAPATAPVFTNTKPFWEPDASMSGMDLDFAAEVDIFSASSHKISNSFDWGRNNQMFQETVNLSQPSIQSEQSTTSKRQRPLAPKLPTTTAELAASLPPFDFSSTAVSDDPFSIPNIGGGVDPGLLFSRTSSFSMPSGLEESSLPPARPVTSHVELKPYQHQLRESQRDQEELRRFRGSRENSKARRVERGTVSSPIKSSSRPGLQRSISDSRSKRTQGKSDVTDPSQAAKVTLLQDRIISRAGRVSPVKHQRPISLTSIPEFPVPRTRTEVKFTIDANGRARTETFIVEAEPVTTRGGPITNEEWESSQYESSSDDEPILLPSRNSSFALPAQTKGPKLARFETGNRGVDIRRHSASGYSQSESSSQRSIRRDSIGSEAETVVEEDDGSGDATLELRKIMEERKKSQMKARHPGHHRYISDSTSRGNSRYNSSTNISPTTVTDPDGATPSSSRSGTTRCVCNNPDSEGFMIQWYVSSERASWN
jgi:hypothetical protein